jgi:hypothetical protein
MKRMSLGIGLVLASLMSLPTAASADIPDVNTYAEQQCGAGRWADLGYPSYDECYAYAVDYYYLQVGGGGGNGGGSSGGGSGGTFIGDIPGYEPDGDTGGCKTRACLPGG